MRRVRIACAPDGQPRRNDGGQVICSCVRPECSARHVPPPQPRRRPLEAALVSVPEPTRCRACAVWKILDAPAFGTERRGVRARTPLPVLDESRRRLSHRLSLLVRRDCKGECCPRRRIGRGSKARSPATCASDRRWFNTASQSGNFSDPNRTNSPSKRSAPLLSRSSTQRPNGIPLIYNVGHPR